ncbi:hypothetical protein, variant 2 [Aphanomyces astaci]|uniref:Myb-like domain-containing protein n=1 Tax=Aphanomyces astaci TaxID=112090 RepID=W4G845_APHAT|nr:hypothetical protein, variant 2 [Aphanomyces astaci]ETV75098.1 hypothetical protein, variant 2 [Aphanomyces astaci]|eukprot:XP_009835602.1 hypothetical protein, variant 2 [Aphanomyces astaci]
MQQRDLTTNTVRPGVLFRMRPPPSVISTTAASPSAWSSPYPSLLPRHLLDTEASTPDAKRLSHAATTPGGTPVAKTNVPSSREHFLALYQKSPMPKILIARQQLHQATTAQTPPPSSHSAPTASTPTTQTPRRRYIFRSNAPTTAASPSVPSTPTPKPTAQGIAGRTEPAALTSSSIPLASPAAVTHPSPSTRAPMATSTPPVALRPPTTLRHPLTPSTSRPQLGRGQTPPTPSVRPGSAPTSDLSSRVGPFRRLSSTPLAAPHAKARLSFEDPPPIPPHIPAQAAPASMKSAPVRNIPPVRSSPQQPSPPPKRSQPSPRRPTASTVPSIPPIPPSEPSTLDTHDRKATGAPGTDEVKARHTTPSKRSLVTLLAPPPSSTTSDSQTVSTSSSHGASTATSNVPVVDLTDSSSSAPPPISTNIVTRSTNTPQRHPQPTNKPASHTADTAAGTPRQMAAAGSSKKQKRGLVQAKGPISAKKQRQGAASVGNSTVETVVPTVKRRTQSSAAKPSPPPHKPPNQTSPINPQISRVHLAETLPPPPVHSHLDQARDKSDDVIPQKATQSAASRRSLTAKPYTKTNTRRTCDNVATRKRRREADSPTSLAKCLSFDDSDDDEEGSSSIDTSRSPSPSTTLSAAAGKPVQGEEGGGSRRRVLALRKWTVVWPPPSDGPSLQLVVRGQVSQGEWESHVVERIRRPRLFVSQTTSQDVSLVGRMVPTPKLPAKVAHQFSHGIPSDWVHMFRSVLGDVKIKSIHQPAQMSAGFSLFHMFRPQSDDDDDEDDVTPASASKLERLQRPPAPPPSSLPRRQINRKTASKPSKQKTVELEVAPPVDTFYSSSDDKTLVKVKPAVSKAVPSKPEVVLQGKTTRSGRVTSPVKAWWKATEEDCATTAADHWTTDQVSSLKQAIHKVDPKDPKYWTKIAKWVDGKSAIQCQTKQFESVESTFTRPRPPTKSMKLNKSQLSRAGTQRFKKQVRQFVVEYEAANDGGDDVCVSPPTYHVTPSTSSRLSTPKSIRKFKRRHHVADDSDESDAAVLLQTVPSSHRDKLDAYNGRLLNQKYTRQHHHPSRSTFQSTKSGAHEVSSVLVLALLVLLVLVCVVLDGRIWGPKDSSAEHPNDWRATAGRGADPQR